MQQFFVKNDSVGDTHITLIEDINHIKNVLRMKPGEQVRISDESGQTWYCDLEEISNEKALARILYKEKANSELPSKIYLFQGLPKGDKMEFIIQKAVELGVHEIIPMAMKNCVVKFDEKKAISKVKRWQAIAKSAAKQSKRSIIPKISNVMTFSEGLQYAKKIELKLLPYENEEGMTYTRQVIGGMGRPESIAVFIGPEGGFDKMEIDLADEDTSIKRLSLGKRILRTETAGMTVMSILVYHLDE